MLSTESDVEELNEQSELHIIVLSTESDVEELNEQSELLIMDLEAHKGYPWILVMFHRNVL
ncbi:MAG: hypothetical protein ACLFVP_04070 [Candidatus Bathyarchaeia archaeon]